MDHLGWNRSGTRIRQLTRFPALMAGSNETHTQTPNTPAVVAPNA